MVRLTIILVTVAVALTISPLVRETASAEVTSCATSADQTKEQLHVILRRLDQLERYCGLKNENREFWVLESPDGELGNLGKAGSKQYRHHPGSISNLTRFQPSQNQLERKIKMLIQISTVPTSLKRAAIVPVPYIVAKSNAPRTLSCSSREEPIKLCLWGRTVRGEHEAIVIQEGVAVPVDVWGQSVDPRFKIPVCDPRLENGTCSLHIEPITEDDFGVWSCTLIGQTGAVFTGQVTISKEEDIKPSIYFINGNNLQTYFVATSKVDTLGNTGAYRGVAYDPNMDKLYWSTDSGIFRGERNGTGAETLLNSTQYGAIYALDVDWITGNVYGSTLTGNVFVCSTTIQGKFPCAVVLSGLKNVEGIALDPTQGLMYLAEGHANGLIKRAGMDGTNLITFVSPVHSPRGITVDFHNSRLYWASQDSANVQSCDLEGKDIRTAVQLAAGSRPWGFTLFEERIYVGNRAKNRVESYSKTGVDFRVLFTGSGALFHLVGLPRSDLPRTRANDCENRVCSKVCVLTPTSFSCVS